MKGKDNMKPPVWESLYKLNNERITLLEKKMKEKEIKLLENDGFDQHSNSL